ncbi:hypothetical protein C7448_105230 [Tenacibaculum gallaicum]|uniref:Uncharacterized protein n=1 Tax=Tenacibaculum gallaicum TaxID=561505 RepID=A0A3E0HR91_9FLAO|nr:hypothetical protein [Tenacibaculum gallaicum]REH48947.1 hypothetical protein C7448_105230 [Tenacibaculum gallaicum]
MRVTNTFLIALISLSLFSCNSKKQLENKWDKLIKADSEQVEIKRIEELSDFISEINGHFKMNGITQSKDALNLLTQTKDSIKINHINLLIYWKENSFHAKNWKPINQNNIYLLFRE